MRGIVSGGGGLRQLQRFERADLRKLGVLTWDRAREHRLKPLAPERAGRLHLRERNGGIAARSHAFDSPTKLLLACAPHEFAHDKEQGSRRTPASAPPDIISSRHSPAARPSASRFMSTLVKRRPGALGHDLPIVEAHDRDVAGHGEPKFAQGVDRAARDLVVAAEERVWRRPAATEEAPRCLAPPGLRPVAGQAFVRLRHKPGLARARRDSPASRKRTASKRSGPVI